MLDLLESQGPIGSYDFKRGWFSVAASRCHDEAHLPKHGNLVVHGGAHSCQQLSHLCRAHYLLALLGSPCYVLEKCSPVLGFIQWQLRYQCYTNGMPFEHSYSASN